MAKVYVRPDADNVRYISNYAKYSGKGGQNRKEGSVPLMHQNSSE